MTARARPRARSRSMSRRHNVRPTRSFVKSAPGLLGGHVEVDHQTARRRGDAQRKDPFDDGDRRPVERDLLVPVQALGSGIEARDPHARGMGLERRQTDLEEIERVVVTIVSLGLVSAGARPVDGTAKIVDAEEHRGPASAPEPGDQAIGEGRLAAAVDAVDRDDGGSCPEARRLGWCRIAHRLRPCRRRSKGPAAPAAPHDRRRCWPGCRAGGRCPAGYSERAGRRRR